VEGLLPFAKAALYLLAARLILRHLEGKTREVAFALVNVAGYYLVFVNGSDARFGFAFCVYVPIVLIFYFLMQAFSEDKGAKAWLAFFAPILALMILRYVPTSFYAHFRESLRVKLIQNSDFSLAGFFLGFSYLAFRCSHLVLEVRSGAVKKPDFWQYLGFSFFVPTMTVGPINVYSNYRRGFELTPPLLPEGRCFLRILVGLVKYLFLGNVVNQLSYSGMVLDSHYHHWIDLPIAAIAYYIYLYCNFSGFCDMAIGGAGLIGIPVTENFNNPFYARNMREFWNRWHITLSQYMRDVCFSPLSKYFGRLMGPANINHAIALTIMLIFILIGIWHGTGWNYLVFGFLNGIGVFAAHYYTLGLKKWLGRNGFQAYNANPWIQAVAVVVTFSYFAMTLFFFANSPKDIHDILSVMR
jgi:D-alanyl-lipoteichoic acid acyltransferase DltB (MBOAT superfamily)